MLLDCSFAKGAKTICHFSMLAGEAILWPKIISPYLLASSSTKHPSQFVYIICYPHTGRCGSKHMGLLPKTWAEAKSNLKILAYWLAITYYRQQIAGSDSIIHFQLLANMAQKFILISQNSYLPMFGLAIIY